MEVGAKKKEKRKHKRRVLADGVAVVLADGARRGDPCGRPVRKRTGTDMRTTSKRAD
jgi:hypothetical protein